MYWLRAIQYFGGKVEAANAGNRPVNLANAGNWNLDALPALLDIVTELDPQFIAAYRFGAAFLPEANALELLGRGLRENPADWRLALDLGYVHWRQGRFAAARAARPTHPDSAPVRRQVPSQPAGKIKHTHFRSFS